MLKLNYVGWGMILFAFGSANGVAAETLHNSASLLDDTYRMLAVESQLTAQLALAEARAELTRNQKVHDQNVRAGNAVARFEVALSRLRVLEAHGKVREAEHKIDEAKADERMWALRVRADRGWSVSIVDLARAHSEFWESRHRGAVVTQARAQGALDFLNEETRLTRGLVGRGAVSLRDLYDLEVLRDQAQAQTDIAKQKAAATEKFWKESIDALTWVGRQPAVKPMPPAVD